MFVPFVKATVSLCGYVWAWVPVAEISPAVYNVTRRSGLAANNYRVKVNDLGSDPDCDNCGENLLESSNHSQWPLM